MQALKSDEAKDVATTNITRVINIEAPRGQIYDSSGKLLVGNRVVASVTLNPKEIEDSEMDSKALNEMLTEIAMEIIRSGKLIKVSDIEAMLENSSYGPYDDIPIAVDVPEDLLVYFGERPNLYPGVKVADRSVRSYLYGSLASHVLGWVGPVTNSELSSRKPVEGKGF